MTKQKAIILIIIPVLLLGINCQKEYDKTTGSNKIVFVESSIDSVSYYQATAGTQVKFGVHKASVINHGHCWSTGHDPDTTNQHTSLGAFSANSSFSSTIKNLLPGTKYYIRPYVSFQDGIIYGQEISFQTLNTGKPLVNTTEILDITNISAKCISEVLSDSGLTITARGVCWSTLHIPTLSDNHTTDGIDIGGYTSTISSLNSGITYYVRAYAANSKGTVYGNELSFRTLSVPTVTTNTVTYNTGDSAVSGGNVTNDGGSLVNVRGVCWSTNQNPTLSDNFTTDGAGSGPYASLLTNLSTSTVYYIRAYATNIVGTAYGNQVSFTSASFVCQPFTITHSAGNIAPVTKTVTYQTVVSNLTGSEKCWITQNLGADHQASSATDATEASAGWYWQFNRKQGYKHDGITLTPNNTWVFPIEDNSNWIIENDPCALLLGTGWRIPTQSEWSSADANSGWNNYNDTYSSTLKLHAAGYLGYDSPLAERGSYGEYWSSTQTILNEFGWALEFTINSSKMINGYKPTGSTLRCLRSLNK